MVTKIDEVEMMRLFKANRTIGEIAKHFHVTYNAVQKMKTRCEKRLAAVPDLSRSEVSRNNIDTVFQLRLMNDHILHELKRCQRLVTREDSAVLEREKLEDLVKKNPQDLALVKKLKEMGPVNINDILKIQSNIISISSEVRKQIELQVKIYETIFNVQMVAEFQEEIIEILRTVDPELKEKVLRKLKERRSLRGLVRLDK